MFLLRLIRNVQTGHHASNFSRRRLIRNGPLPLFKIEPPLPKSVDGLALRELVMHARNNFAKNSLFIDDKNGVPKKNFGVRTHVGYIYIGVNLLFQKPKLIYFSNFQAAD